jgi:hypothetical protein
MADIDIKVSPDLKKLFGLEPCEMIKLPSPKKLTVQLPVGGAKIQAFSDISKGVPNDCSLTLNLMLQIAPFLAASACLFKVLALIEPLMDVIKAVAPPDPIKLAKAMPKLLKAAADLAPCIAFPLGIPFFIRDLLCLIIKVLNCLLGQLKSLLAIMSGITLQLSIAEADGNTDLLDALNCAKENAELQGAHLTQSIEPIGLILKAVGPLMGMAGIPEITLPTIGSGSDLQAMQQLVQTIQGIVGTLQIAADALGGCE